MLTLLDQPTGGETQIYSPQRANDAGAIMLVLGKDVDLVTTSITGTATCVPNDTLSFDQELWSRHLSDVLFFLGASRYSMHHCEPAAFSELTGEWMAVPRATPGTVGLAAPDNEASTGYREAPRIVDWRPWRLRRLERLRVPAKSAFPEIPVEPALPRGAMPTIAGRSVGTNPATELKDASGLHLSELATLLGVSKTTYCAWCRGSGARARHQEHLLQVLALIREASARLDGNAVEVRRWLLTPLWPGGSTPLDLAKERQYRTLRGAVLGLAATQRSFRLVEPLRSTYRHLSRQDMEARLDRLRPHTRGMGEDED